MNVDLLSALEARAAEEPARESVASENEFPRVLQASMTREEPAEARAQEAPSQPAPEQEAPAPREDQDRPQVPSEERRELELEAATADATDWTPEAEASSQTASEQADSEDQASVEAASLGGALASAGTVVDRVRATTETSSAAPVEGRLSELDAVALGETRTGARSDQPSSAEQRAASPGPLAESQAELAREIVESPRRPQEPAPRASASEASSQVKADQAMAEVARDPEMVRVAERPLRSESALPGDRPASDGSINEAREAMPIATAETSSEQGRDPSDDPRSTPFEREDPGQASRPADQVEFDRALDGAQSAGVDPNLRQAVATREDARNAPDAVAVTGGAVVANPIAGSVSEMTPAAPTGSSPAAASEAISVQTEWLATRGGGTARLVLHPQELGEVAIRVTLRGSSVEVVMVAQEAAAQSIAEDQADRLFQALASRDLRMDQFEVRRGEPGDLPQPGTDRFADSDGGQARSGDGRSSGDERASRDGSGASRGATDRTPGGPEIPPRIVSVAETATGVDLRI